MGTCARYFLCDCSAEPIAVSRTGLNDVNGEERSHPSPTMCPSPDSCLGSWLARSSPTPAGSHITDLQKPWRRIRERPPGRAISQPQALFRAREKEAVRQSMFVCPGVQPEVCSSSDFHPSRQAPYRPIGRTTAFLEIAGIQVQFSGLHRNGKGIMFLTER